MRRPSAGILTEDGLEDNKYLAELEKYGLLPAFWRHVEEAFGYSDPKPTLEKLVMACFATYAARSISAGASPGVEAVRHLQVRQHRCVFGPPDEQLSLCGPL